MKLNDLADLKGLKDIKGYDDWTVTLEFQQDDVLFPWLIVLEKGEAEEVYTATGGTPDEAYRNARHKAKI